MNVVIYKHIGQRLADRFPRGGATMTGFVSRAIELALADGSEELEPAAAVPPLEEVSMQDLMLLLANIAGRVAVMQADRPEAPAIVDQYEIEAVLMELSRRMKNTMEDEIAELKEMAS